MRRVAHDRDLEGQAIPTENLGDAPFNPTHSGLEAGDDSPAVPHRAGLPDHQEHLAGRGPWVALDGLGLDEHGWLEAQGPIRMLALRLRAPRWRVATTGQQLVDVEEATPARCTAGM